MIYRVFVLFCCFSVLPPVAVAASYIQRDSIVQKVFHKTTSTGDACDIQTRSYPLLPFGEFRDIREFTASDGVSDCSHLNFTANVDRTDNELTFNGRIHSGYQIDFAPGIPFIIEGMTVGTEWSEESDMYQWNSDYEIYLGVLRSQFHAQTLEDVSVPGGEFSQCLKVVWDYENDFDESLSIEDSYGSYQFWWCDDSGLVKYTYDKFSSSGVQLNSEIWVMDSIMDGAFVAGDLEITIGATTSYANIGEDLQLFLNITNHGTSSVNNIKIRVTLPDNYHAYGHDGENEFIINGGSIDSGASVVAMVNGYFTSEGFGDFTVEVAGDISDTVPANNTDTLHVVAMEENVDMAVSVSCPDTVEVDESFSCQATMTNVGTTAAYQPSRCIHIPSGISPVGGTHFSSVCVSPIGYMMPGESMSENFRFAAEESGSYVITSDVTVFRQTDSQMQNNSIEVLIDVSDLAVPGDQDGDLDVDRDDIRVVLAAVNTPSSGEDDVRDVNGDGMITVTDARALVRLCTRSRCATE